MVLNNRKSFTLIEIVVTSLVAMLIFMAAWAIYIMGWTWWYQISPRIEAQRIARLAVAKTIDGLQDQTAGFDLVGSSRYERRNGLSASFYYPPDLVNTQVDSEGKTFARQIRFGTYADYGTFSPAAKNNVRSFYLDTDPDTGANIVFYMDGSGIVHKIRETLGISDLRFYINEWIDGHGVTHKDVLVKATVEKDVIRTGSQPYHVKVEYSGYTGLRNLQ